MEPYFIYSFICFGFLIIPLSAQLKLEEGGRLIDVPSPPSPLGNMRCSELTLTGSNLCPCVHLAADVAQQFQYAVRVIGSNFAPTVERDEFLVAEKNQERTYVFFFGAALCRSLELVYVRVYAYICTRVLPGTVQRQVLLRGYKNMH